MNLTERRDRLTFLWAADLNGNLSLADIRQYQPMWWRCPAGHTWLNSAKQQSRRKHPCQQCVMDATAASLGRWGTQAPHVTSLAAARPDLAAQWHPTLNGPLTPGTVGTGSHRKAWWLCPEGHTYQAMVFNRTSTSCPTGCPTCAGYKQRTSKSRDTSKTVKVGVNDLASVNPAAAALWHPDLNGTLTPRMVTAGSNQVVWWLLPCGHPKQVSVWDKTAHPATRCNDCVKAKAA